MGVPLNFDKGGITKIKISEQVINDSDDAQNTPSEPYRELCLEAGAEVSVHDPYVVSYPGVEISSDLEEVIKGADVVVIFAGHTVYFDLKAERLKEACGKERPVIVDGRNVIGLDEFIEEGFVYKGIGRGDKNGHEMK